MDRSILQRGFPVVLLAVALAVAALAVDELKLPADVTYRGAESSPGPVVFSRATHAAFLDNRCLACHPEHFAILRPAGRITHEEMDAGRQCGVCSQRQGRERCQRGLRFLPPGRELLMRR